MAATEVVFVAHRLMEWGVDLLAVTGPTRVAPAAREGDDMPWIKVKRRVRRTHQPSRIPSLLLTGLALLLLVECLGACDDEATRREVQLHMRGWRPPRRDQIVTNVWTGEIDADATPGGVYNDVVMNLNGGGIGSDF